jgi:serine/threonine-protein kinase RsbW
MAHAKVATPVSQSFQLASYVELRDSLPTHVDLISPFVDELMRFISRFRVSDENNSEIELALREALVNAMVHGNQQDPHKRVYVKCRCAADGEVSLTVEDEGHGSENHVVMDPSSADHRPRIRGREMYMITALMDEVDFERDGSVVHMRKRATVGSDTTRKPQ